MEEPNALIVQELTGKYGSDNTGGYGTPNIKLSNVKSARFEIFKPNATTPVIYTVFPDYPTDDVKLQYELLTAALGVKYLESGVWKVKYIISGETDAGVPFEYSTETKEVFMHHAKCCVDKLTAHTANIPANALYKDERKKAAAELRMLFESTEWLKCHGDFNSAQTNLDYINLQCLDCCV